jgi:hypothetical protein
MDDRERLAKVHARRMRAHFGKNYDPFLPGRWPQDDKEWRQTPHGAPWDTNVEMAKWHLDLAQDLKNEGLLT